MRVLPSGTSALLLEVDEPDDVLDLYDALALSTPVGVVDLVPAARTVLVVIDPALTSLADTRRAVAELTPVAGRRTPGPLVTIPVVYDGADLAAAAAMVGADAAELVRRHLAAVWTVAFCGFAPGFGYLTCTDRTLHLPRLPTPRTRVPAGSVALGGGYSAVYPRESPGGWQLIGRTQAVLFDVRRDPPALLRPGARVRFVPERG